MNNCDIYFEKNYGQLYENIEKGKTEIFNYKDENGEIRYMFIKRKVPYLINGKQYYDITTPYGYGGPIILTYNDKKELIKNYHNKFSAYCLKNDIICEFIRFHPVFHNAQDFNKIYEVEYLHETVGTNLKIENAIKEEFSKKCMKNIRRSLNKGVTYKVIEDIQDISEFIHIYYATMDRNAASEFYYFDKEYFQSCLSFFKSNLIYVQAIYEEQTIAAGLYFVWNKLIHIHLSGTLSEYLALSPAYVLRYAVTKWGIAHGYELIHHGGGRTNSKADGLYTFKKQFGKNTSFSFYIGKKIRNKKIYDELCKKNVNKQENFFPQYRTR